MSQIRRSLAINGITHVICFIFSLASIAVVARLLSPSEIGLFSVAASLVAIGHVFRDFGIGQYLVQATKVSRDQLRAANTVMICISWFIALILLIIRNPAAGFYQNDGIIDILTVLAWNFIILPFGAPLLSMLRREMKFGRIAVVSVGSIIVHSFTTIYLALNGYGYMSMAWGSLAGIITNTLILIAMRPSDALLLPKFSGIKEVLRFGYKSSSATLAIEAGTSAPDLILGRTLGLAEVAFYNRAWSMMSLVMESFVNIIKGVFFPAFAESVRNGANALSAYLQASVQLTGFTIPMLAVFALLSDPMIYLLFGPQWERSGPLATLICLYAMLVAPFSLGGVALVACGKIDILMRAQFLILGARILTLSTAFFLNLEQIVLVLGAAYCIEARIYIAAMKTAIGLTFSILIQSFWRSYALALITIIGPAAMVLYLYLVETNLGSFSLVLVAGTLATFFWLAGLYLLHHPLTPEIERIRISLLRRVERQKIS